MTEANEQALTEGQETQAAAEEPRKMTLAEAAKLKMQQKKQAQAVGKRGPGQSTGGAKELRSQLTKKPNNQRKRMGV